MDTRDPFAVGRYLSSLTDNARGRWLTALLDSDDIRARAAGLFLQNFLTPGGEVRPIAEQSRDALVQLAVGAGDPAIYAMAVYACDRNVDPAPGGACQRITLNTWANLDQDNAVPWLLLAGKAHAKKDAAAENAAFAEAAKARKVDAYNFSLYAYSAADMPADVTPLERAFLAIELVGIESANVPLQHSSASKHCSADAMHDTDVRQQCSALAELLVSKGTTLLDINMGAAIGTRVGWAKTRVEGLVQEHDALLQAIEQATTSDKEGQWTCESARRENAYMAQWARLGEIGAARALLAQSGETAAALAEKQRIFIEKLRRDFQRQDEASVSEPQP